MQPGTLLQCHAGTRDQLHRAVAVQRGVALAPLLGQLTLGQQQQGAFVAPGLGQQGVQQRFGLIRAAQLQSHQRLAQAPAALQLGFCRRGLAQQALGLDQGASLAQALGFGQAGIGTGRPSQGQAPAHRKHGGQSHGVLRERAAPARCRSLVSFPFLRHGSNGPVAPAAHSPYMNRCSPALLPPRMT